MKPTATTAQGTIDVKGYNGLPDHTLTWTLEAGPVTSPSTKAKATKAEAEASTRQSLANETWTILQEWYEARGEKVPAEEAKLCKRMIQEEEAAWKKSLGEIGSGLPEEALPKPAYGTPEFWKQYWAKKKAAAAAAAAK
jgi:hypothetical protein